MKSAAFDVDLDVSAAMPADLAARVIATLSPRARRLSLRVDPARFQPLDKFKAEVDRHSRELRTSKVLPGADAVRLPGDQRAARRADRLANGLMLSPELLVQLENMAAELGIKPLKERV